MMNFYRIPTKQTLHDDFLITLFDRPDGMLKDYLTGNKRQWGELEESTWWLALILLLPKFQK